MGDVEAAENKRWKDEKEMKRVRMERKMKGSLEKRGRK